MPRLTVAMPNAHREVDEPTPEDVVAAIGSLQGAGEVSLGEPTEIWLGVAGGPGRYFVGFSSVQDGTTLQARAIDPHGGPIDAVIGGQPTTLDPAYLVPIGVATTAALHFLQAEEASPAITWDPV